MSKLALPILVSFRNIRYEVFPVQFQEFSISIVKSLPIRTHTKDSYSSMLRVHINPKIGCMKLEKISRKNVKDFLVGLRPQTAALVLSVVKMIFAKR